MILSSTTKREHVRYVFLHNNILQDTFKDMETYVLMAEASASGHKSKQEISTINNDLNLIKDEVMSTLTDKIPYIEALRWRRM